MLISKKALACTATVAALLLAGCSGSAGSQESGVARGLADDASASASATSDSTADAPCALKASGDCSGADLSGMDLSGMNLEGANFAGANLSNAKLDGALLFGANLEKSNLKGASLNGTELMSARLSGSNLVEAILTGAVLIGQDFRSFDLAGANLAGVVLDNSNFAGMNLQGTSFEGAFAPGVNFTGADLAGADFTGARVGGANFTSALLPTVNPDDPMFTGSQMCQTKMAGGVINSSDCPCTGAGASGATGEAMTLGAMALGAYPRPVRNWDFAQSQVIAVDEFMELYTAIQDVWGSQNPGSDFNLPVVTGPWAGVRTGEDGDGQCLGWSVALNGLWPEAGETYAYPGEVIFSAAGEDREWIDGMAQAGATVDTNVTSYLGQGFVAFDIPAGWKADATDSAYLGSLHLFTSSQPLPSTVVPADGSPISPKKDAALYALLGANRPLVVAPDGYVWGITSQGSLPTWN